MIRQHVLQTEPKPSISNPILVGIALVGLCVWSAVAPATGCTPMTNWNYLGSGSWFDGNKWDNGVPDSNKDAFINNAGIANIVGVVHAGACNLTLGYGAANSGTVSMNGGSLAVVHELEVGAYGKGTLSITNGASVTAELLTIAALHGNPSSSGTVTVDGATFTINTRADVGGDNGTPGGVGLMTVTNGGTVSASTFRVDSSGTLTGNGTVSTSSGTTVDGTLSPSGTLSVSGSGGLALRSGATTVCHVAPSGADNIYVSATASLDGRLTVTMTGTFTAGTQFTLLHSQGVLSSTFSSVSINYPTNQCFTPQINYDYVGNNVYLYLVPTCW